MLACRIAADKAHASLNLGEALDQQLQEERLRLCIPFHVVNCSRVRKDYESIKCCLWPSALSQSQVAASLEKGLHMKDKSDKKALFVDPTCDDPGDDTTRLEVVDPDYLQVVVFTHKVRHH